MRGLLSRMGKVLVLAWLWKRTDGVVEVQEEELLQSRWPQRRIHSSGGRGWWSASDAEFSKARRGTGQARIQAHKTTLTRMERGINSQQWEQEGKARQAIPARQQTKEMVSRARLVGGGDY
jgi:hypothetical protein